MSKTDKIETHNLWKRALYHALAMSDLPGSNMLAKLREALELP